MKKTREKLFFTWSAGTPARGGRRQAEERRSSSRSPTCGTCTPNLGPWTSLLHLQSTTGTCRGLTAPRWGHWCRSRRWFARRGRRPTLSGWNIYIHPSWLRLEEEESGEDEEPKKRGKQGRTGEYYGVCPSGNRVNSQKKGVTMCRVGTFTTQNCTNHSLVSGPTLINLIFIYLTDNLASAGRIVPSKT